MELRLLGPVEVHTGTRRLAGGRPQQAVVLAALAVDAGRLVPVESLIVRVWGSSPPPRARQLLQTHINRIRRMLGEAAGGGGLVVRRADGYLLELAPERVDMHRFGRLVERAAAAGHSAEDRVELLREALGLWRGEPLAGLSGQWVEHTRHVWRQQRLSALLAWARAELEVSNAPAVIDRVTGELAEHPLVEPLAAVLMRALAAAGRAAEALDRYAATRAHLAEELGADPGPELQAVHQAILRGEGGPPPPAATAAASQHTPAQLPADVAAFTGRGDELERLDAILAAPGGTAAAAVVLSAVSGTAGVGKTALAIHWAHQVRGRFPDGQLYVNLRGYDPDQPVTAADALARFLAALGVPGPEIPLDQDERAARYRSALAGRRMLILLDNASSAEQVRPLLPGTGGCAVVITSRDRLAGLVARDGAHRLDLDLLPPADAYALLHRLIGDRTHAEPVATASLVDLCARLPLALRVAAELAVSRPGTSLTRLAGELAERQRRLELLDAGGDPRSTVAMVFSWSIQHLPPEAARTFRLLGLHPGADADAYAVAALTGADLAATRRDLDTLTRAHLVDPTAPGRYGMHDLLRAYAASLASTQDTEDTRSAALDRLYAYYLATAMTAMDHLYPAESHRRPRVPPPSTPSPALAGAGSARAWLDAERAALVATVRGAPPGSAYPTLLSTTLFRYLDGGHYTDAMAVHDAAYEAARQAGDLAGQAHALRGIGAVHLKLGRYTAAAEHFEQAATLFAKADDLAGQAVALTALGTVEQRQGTYASAADHHQQAMALFRQAGDGSGEGRALNNLAIIETLLGRHAESARHHEEAATLARQAGDGSGEAAALNNLGLVEQRLGRDEEAAEHHRQAVALFRQLGDRSGEASSLDNLGIAHTRLGQPAQAATYFELALTLFREIGDREGQAWALNGLGEAAHARGEPGDALEHHGAALAITLDIGAVDQQARALAGLGHAHHALGDAERARSRYGEALVLYTDLESFEAAKVRTRLAALPPQP
ncbi:AfsR/SARP family transcriptional regulator [Phytohabitans houttuyneae]|uniref:SARP family transcriptional regulator n=1 Tax=Phytohabitans houttuyneae TaxID=1076126 RepID=A0A6V8K7U2_9ACTN|nr:tetratricopeptide repeat protein [Phytohabitans houttuyneae]GFJ79590.1 SARP family transcriptional regulator [Phytohabitans houttuyneae]